MYAGRTRGGQGGVGLYVNQKATKSLLGYHPVNDRIISVHLRGKVKDVTVIQTYAPTSNATEEDRELFYSQLQMHVNKYRKDVVVIVGDFNDKVGKRTNENEKRAIGNFALGERNDNGEELVNFAIENELSILNTMFQKHPRRLFTWTSPDGNTKNQILVQQRWKSAISNVVMVPSADCDSHHEMLKATFKIRLRTMKKFQMPIRYDTSNISKEYCTEVSNKFEALNATTEEMRPEELANKAKEIFTEASKHLKTKQKKKQKWLSHEALQKMQERRMAKSKGQHQEDYKKKVREVKQIIRRDKKKYIEDKSEQIENNFSKNRSRDAYNIIKSLTKTFQPKTVVIKDENGNVHRVQTDSRSVEEA